MEQKAIGTRNLLTTFIYKKNKRCDFTTTTLTQTKNLNLITN